jgi:hypothetical protein
MLQKVKSKNFNKLLLGLSPDLAGMPLDAVKQESIFGGRTTRLFY